MTAGARKPGTAAVAKGRSAAAAATHLKIAPPERPFEFLDSRVQVPRPRPGAIPRKPLVNKLRAATGNSVTTVVAPGGYGKTTLLSQWAARDPRPFAWVTIDERDNDPVVLLQHIAAALAQNVPSNPDLVAALRSAPGAIWSAALPRLAAELSAQSPIVLVLDDFNLLHSRASLEAVSALIDDEVEGSTLVTSTRVSPNIPLASLRASGRLLELGVEDLALSKRESQLLLQAAGVALPEERESALIEQCEGWAGALYLAALSIRDGEHHEGSTSDFDGGDRYVTDYFRSEYLSRLRPGPMRFLRRTSVLDRMCGPLCDAVLEDEGSSRELEKIERANLFVVPLDNRREWYRYHHLFRELLQRELADEEPQLVPILHGRAADWFEANGDRESALEHAYAAGDTDRAADILSAIALPMYDAGRVATLERWFKRFARAGLLERYPGVALHGSRVHMLQGRTDEAIAWLEAATASSSAAVKLPDGSGSVAPWAATVRAWLCRAGAKQMLADADEAVAGLPEDSNWLPSALVARGAALVLLRKDAEADAVLVSAAESAASHGSTEMQVTAVAERTRLAASRDDYPLARELASEASRLVSTSAAEGAPARTIEQAASARVLLQRGRWNEVRACLTIALDLLPNVTSAIPWLAVESRIELGRAFATLRDAPAANELLSEIDDILAHAPGLDMLADSADELRREIDVVPVVEGSAAGLTPAELRVLPLLATHLSFREIAEQLFVSRNTIKTQAISVYRKLGVSSRSEAIAEAHRLGLGQHLRVVVSNDR